MLWNLYVRWNVHSHIKKKKVFRISWLLLLSSFHQFKSFEKKRKEIYSWLDFSGIRKSNWNREHYENEEKIKFELHVLMIHKFDQYKCDVLDSAQTVFKKWLIYLVNKHGNANEGEWKREEREWEWENRQKRKDEK